MNSKGKIFLFHFPLSFLFPLFFFFPSFSLSFPLFFPSPCCHFLSLLAVENNNNKTQHTHISHSFPVIFTSPVFPFSFSSILPHSSSNFGSKGKSINPHHLPLHFLSLMVSFSLLLVEVCWVVSWKPWMGEEEELANDPMCYLTLGRVCGEWN